MMLYRDTAKKKNPNADGFCTVESGHPISVVRPFAPPWWLMILGAVNTMVNTIQCILGVCIRQARE